MNENNSKIYNNFYISSQKKGNFSITYLLANRLIRINSAEFLTKDFYIFL